jgi:uncharacterized protein (DUF58 family)
VSAVVRAATKRETNLRQLELAITRRLDGLLHGEHHAFAAGSGSEAGEGRVYQPGDDARRIDWSLTARSNEVHIRNTIADRELETWLIIDATASLDFGTADWEKCDLALTTAAAFGLLGARSGNRTAAMVFDGEKMRIVPPRGGRDAVLDLLRRVERRSRGDGLTTDAAHASTPTLATAIRRTCATARRRGRIVVISDLIDSSPWVDELRVAAVRHDVIVAEVSDPREWSLPAVGLLTLVDPETGRRREVQTADARLRAHFMTAAAAEQVRIAAAVRSTGARHLRLSTDRDWMLDLVRFADKRSRGAKSRSVS